MWNVGWVNIRSTKRLTLMKVRKLTLLLIEIENRVCAERVEGRRIIKKVIRPRDRRRKITSNMYLIVRTVSGRELRNFLLGRELKVK